MSKHVYVDANGKAVAKGSPESAYQFVEGTAQLEKFQKARAGKAPAAKPADEGAKK